MELLKSPLQRLILQMSGKILVWEALMTPCTKPYFCPTSGKRTWTELIVNVSFRVPQKHDGIARAPTFHLDSWTGRWTEASLICNICVLVSRVRDSSHFGVMVWYAQN